MQFTEPTESLKQYEELKKNQNPSGHKLALRMMEAAAELGATEEDFEFATTYIWEWINATKDIHAITLAEVKGNRDAFVKASVER